MKASTTLAFGFICLLSAAVVHATPIQVEMTTTNGVVPGTSINYDISISGDDGGPRNIFPSASSDNGVWQWQGSNPNFPEFLSFGNAETLTVNFSAPVPISDIVLGINSTSASDSSVTIVGASLADLNLKDSLQVYTGATGAASYDPATGAITATGQNQSIMLGSTSSQGIASFTLNAGASDGGADGYTVFLGFVQPAAATTPLPGAFGSGLVGIAILALWRAVRRFRPAAA